MKCNNCRSKKLILITKIKGRSIYECKNCSLAAVFPKPSKIQIDNVIKKISNNFYKEYITEKYSYMQYFHKKLDEITKYKKKGSLLEIGCGRGLFLEIAKKKKWCVFGIDLSREAVKICNKNQLNVKYGTLGTVKLKSKKFDVIAAFQLIEHVDDPTKLLQKISEKQNKGGVLMITTPNRKGILASLSGKYWYDYYNKEHLYFFTQRVLEEMVVNAGYEILVSNKEASRNINLLYQWRRFVYYYYTPDTTIFKIIIKFQPLIDLIGGYISFREPIVNLNIIAKKL